MQQIPLAALPNQAISFNVDGSYWNLHIYQGINFMHADIARDGVNVINGIRCFVGQPLMPYQYMYKPQFGNFIFDANVDWTDFAAGCNLFYLNNDELQQFLNLQKVN